MTGVTYKLLGRPLTITGREDERFTGSVIYHDTFSPCDRWLAFGARLHLIMYFKVVFTPIFGCAAVRR